MPPVTSGAPEAGRNRSSTVSVSSGATVRRRPEGPSRIPGTSLTKTTRPTGSCCASARAIVSALKIEASHSVSGTTSPNETGS